MLAAESPEHGGECPRIFRAVRGNPMAKAALIDAVIDAAGEAGIPIRIGVNAGSLAEQYAELVAVIGLANETNRHAVALDLQIDEKFR